MPFSDYKTALVTGASSGIGAAVVERFRREGLEVHAIARSREPLERLAERTGCITHVIDVTDREKLARLTSLGIDPWGHRFDDRLLVADIRAQKSAIRFNRELGGPIEPPDRDAQPDLDFRAWMQDQGKGEWSGPH